MFLQGKNKMRNRIVTTYFPIVSASAGVSYSYQLEALVIIKIRNDPRTQFWIVMNTEILKWIHQVEQIILVGDCNSEASEVKTWMETKGLTTIIFNLHRYSDDSITHQRSKD